MQSVFPALSVVLFVQVAAVRRTRMPLVKRSSRSTPAGRASRYRGGNDDAVTDPNQLGTSGSGVIHVYSDPGTHYLQVNSEGKWTLKVVTTP